jgi:hypothetical protein
MERLAVKLLVKETGPVSPEPKTPLKRELETPLSIVYARQVAVEARRNVRLVRSF